MSGAKHCWEARKTQAESSVLKGMESKCAYKLNYEAKSMKFSNKLMEKRSAQVDLGEEKNMGKAKKKQKRK